MKASDKSQFADFNLNKDAMPKYLPYLLNY